MMAFRHRPRSPYGAAMDAIPPYPVPLVQVRDLRLTVPSVAGPVNILRGIDLDVAAGEAVGIVGPSGSGKTSLLMVLAGLERASSGSVMLAGHSITAMDEDALARLRREAIGIVFQAFHLIPTMTALENVAVPLELAGARDATDRARAALDAVGLAHRLTHLPGPALRRRAAARGARPRLRPAAPAAAGRRADRQSRPGDRRCGDGPAVPPARRGRHHADADHARCAPRGPLLAADPSGGWVRGRDRSVSGCSSRWPDARLSAGAAGAARRRAWAVDRAAVPRPRGRGHCGSRLAARGNGSGAGGGRPAHPGWRSGGGERLTAFAGCAARLAARAGCEAVRRRADAVDAGRAIRRAAAGRAEGRRCGLAAGGGGGSADRSPLPRPSRRGGRVGTPPPCGRGAGGGEPVSIAAALSGHGLLAEPVVLDRLNLHPGDIVRLGNASFTVRGALVSEPDRVAAPADPRSPRR